MHHQKKLIDTPLEGDKKFFDTKPMPLLDGDEEELQEGKGLKS